MATNAAMGGPFVILSGDSLERMTRVMLGTLFMNVCGTITQRNLTYVEFFPYRNN